MLGGEKVEPITLPRHSCCHYSVFYELECIALSPSNFVLIITKTTMVEKEVNVLILSYLAKLK